jgi:endonuclease G
MKELRFQVLQDAAERWNQRSEKRAGAKVTVAALGSGAADSAARQDRYKRRETKLLEASALQKRGELPLFIERKIGPTLDYLSAAPSEAARKPDAPSHGSLLRPIRGCSRRARRQAFSWLRRSC